MSDGNGGKITGVVTALFLVLSIGLTALAIWDAAVSHTEDAIGARQSAREYAENAKKQIAESCVGSEPVALRECIQKIVEATDENERAENDLVAQKDMARWAFFLLIASIVGTAFTGVGIWFVRENLLEMQRGRKISEDATKAALEANKHAQRALSADRAWLLFYRTETSMASQINVDGVVHIEGIAVTIRFMNSGRSPAVKAGLTRTLFALPVRGTEQFTINFPSQEGTGTIAPGLEFRFPQFAIVAEQLTKFRAHEIKIRVHALVWYRDVFVPSIKHTTTAIIDLTHNGYQIENGIKTDQITVSVEGDPRQDAT